jgi:hypothetical protein
MARGAGMIVQWAKHGAGIPNCFVLKFRAGVEEAFLFRFMLEVL